ncbi:hypothetical protein M1146_07615, partial [Patescibacteria group bacterium]|nr:hypothetical protein [Patescibacteria group bacterium]
LSQTASTVKPSAPQIPRKATITEDQILANAQALAEGLLFELFLFFGRTYFGGTTLFILSSVARGVVHQYLHKNY